jgi:hypothetical protein
MSDRQRTVIYVRMSRWFDVGVDQESNWYFTAALWDKIDSNYH